MATLSTLVLVLGLWALIFVWKPLNFWLLMSFAQLALMAVAVRLRPEIKGMLRPSGRDVALGIVSALLLYGLFVAGKQVSSILFPFAEAQIGHIYALRGQAAPALIGLLLLLVIGPGEEIYWRGLLQRTLAERWGKGVGMAATLACYAAVHAVAANFMLLGAAAVGGLFWGLLYLWRNSLPANVISHAAWDVLIMVALPIS